MKKKKPLLPAQRRFLQYIMERHPPVFDRFTEDRIRTALNNDEYLPGGLHEKDFNMLRENYISDFHAFEQTDGDTDSREIWLQSELDSELKEWYEELMK